MALSQPYTGTAAVTGTEYSLPNASTTLTPITVQGIFQLFLDVSAMAAGDSYALKIKEKAVSGGTQRVLQTVKLYGPMADPLYVTAALQLMNGWDITLTKITGTNRSFDYSIRQVA